MGMLRFRWDDRYGAAAQVAMTVAFDASKAEEEQREFSFVVGTKLRVFITIWPLDPK